MDTKELIKNYISTIAEKHETKEATEHTYRFALETLLQALISGRKGDSRISIINEPKRREFGAPDFELRQGLMMISFIETKDIGDTDLRGTKASMNKRQFDKYKC